MGAVPHYPFPHTGTLIVIGGDPNGADEVAEARRLRPHAKVMCVNSASRRFAGDFIASGHLEELRDWRLAQAAINPRPFTVHTSKFHRRVRREDYPYIDYFWTGCVSRATSTFCGVRIGQAMGFREIIVAAAPLDESFDRIHGKREADIHRVALAEEARTYENVSAMSGYSASILGRPVELAHGAV